MQKTIKILALLHILTAMNMFLFWAGFYSGLIFPKDVLQDKIANFDGYYAWETAFTVPDFLVAVVMMIGAVRILKNGRDMLGSVLLLAASGALIFLGVLDFNYGLTNGMFTLGHMFSFVILAIGAYLPLFGAVSIYLLYKNLTARN